MSRAFTKISAAVAIALTGGAAYALPPTTTTFDISVVVSGSSAFRDSFGNLVALNLGTANTQICKTGTFDSYGPAASSGTTDGFTSGNTATDFRAYTCTIDAASKIAALDPTLANKTLAVYYRSEGGSVWGYGPLAKQIQVKRLVVNSACTLKDAGGPAGTNRYVCPVDKAGWNLSTDSDSTANQNIVDATSVLGVTDVEPAAHTGENWVPANAKLNTGGSHVGEPTKTEFNTLTYTPVLGQVFGVYINTAGNAAVAGITNLSKQTLSAIFQGAYTDWNQTPEANPNGTLGSVPIVLCRRDVGSGTQTVTSIYFNNQVCGNNSNYGAAAYTFASTPGAGLIINNATPDMDTCVSTHPNAVGFRSFTTAPSNTKFVNINGSVPSKVNAAAGSYDFWYEVNFVKGAAYNAAPQAVKDVVDDLIALAQDSPTGPQTASVFFTPGIGASGNAPVLPISTTAPVGLGTRGGNSCTAPYGLN